MEMKPVLVFDMDGVLVDVSQSYREAIRATVRHFTGQEITPELIQDYKNAGGWNNDWALSQKIASDLGTEVPYDTVVQEFQVFFFGPGGNDGLVLREKWLPEPGLLERLSQRYHLAIFTGRLHSEADFTLGRFAPGLHWAHLLGDDDVAKSKPDPDGLLQIAAMHPGAAITYVGDTVDDARPGRAAGVRFIGIADRNNPRHDELVALLKAEGAAAVIENINELEQVL